MSATTTAGDPRAAPQRRLAAARAPSSPSTSRCSNKLLAKDPAQRFGSAREVLEALEQYGAPATGADAAARARGLVVGAGQALEVEQVAIGEMRRRHVLQAAEQPLGAARVLLAPSSRAWP